LNTVKLTVVSLAASPRVDMQVRGSLAPDDQAIGHAARLHVERDVVLLCQRGDQLRAAFRGGFLVGVDEQGDLLEIGELHLPQQLDTEQRRHDAALVVHHAGTVGTLALDAERARGGGAVGKHCIHVGHQQDLRGAGSLQRGHQVFSGSRCGR
jgi:hypothetical protein